MSPLISHRWKKVAGGVKTRRAEKDRIKDMLPVWPERAERRLGLEHTRTLDAMVARMFWGIGLVVAVVGYALFHLTTIISLIITGFIVALALERLIKFWQRLGASRNFALGWSYLLLIVFMLSGLIIMIPFIATQLAGLIQLAVDATQQLQQHIQTNGLDTLIQQSNLPDFFKSRLERQATDSGWLLTLQNAFIENMSQVVSLGGESLKSAGSFAVNLVDGVFNVFIQIVLVMTIAVFFSLERQPVLSFIASITNNPPRTYSLLQRISEKLGMWLEGQLLLCIIIGVCVRVGLWVISLLGFDLPNKFSLALIAGLTEFLPYVGPIIGSIPALLVASLTFGRKGFLVVVLLYRAIQTVENNIIVPAVMSHKLGVSPLVIILCMLLGASLFGFLGILLAVPSAVIISLAVGSRGVKAK